MVAGMVLGMAAGAALAAQGGVAVRGVVVDESGGAVAGATVRLSGSTAPARTTTTDPAGAFTFDGVAPGTLDLEASQPSFVPASARVRVGADAPGPIRLVLTVSAVREAVTVTGAATDKLTRAETTAARRALIASGNLEAYLSA